MAKVSEWAIPSLLQFETWCQNELIRVAFFVLNVWTHSLVKKRCPVLGHPYNEQTAWWLKLNNKFKGLLRVILTLQLNQIIHPIKAYKDNNIDGAL